MEVPNFEIFKDVNFVFNGVGFSDCHIVCVQHIVASTVSLFNNLFENDLNPSNLSAIGKCYSTRPEALQHLLEKNVDVSLDSLHFNPYNSFDAEFRRVLLNFFQKKIMELERIGCKKLVVLDDGGELLLFINALMKKRNFWKDRVVGVEQTTSGYEKLKLVDLQFPVVNVARSCIKLFQESPFIAKVAVDRMIDHLNKLRLFPKKALIIGNGAIGSHIHSEIKDLFETEIFDLNQSKSTIRDALDSAILGSFDLLIGCTGKTVIAPHLFRFLKANACLVSVSSSDREFSGFDLRRRIKNISSCHQDIYSEGVHLLNCGFPINFDNAYEEIDIPEFQLTRAILLAGLYQSIANQLPVGLVNLDLNLQETIRLSDLRSTQCLLQIGSS